jgi:hypothetical protein
MCLCFLQEELYSQIDLSQEWVPMKRVLMDSDQKHLIYVIDVNDSWEYIRFPLSLWKSIDESIVKDQDILLVLSKTENNEVHKSILLKDFHKETKDLILNMRDNANYGEDMSKLVEEHFARTIEQLV